MRDSLPPAATVAALTLLFLASQAAASTRSENPRALDASKTHLPRIYLYGGPGSQEGRFEDAVGQPDWQGWTSIDYTDDPDQPFWQRSEFNAANLHDNGAGNHAMWCGKSAEQVSGWATPPGYGNGWDAQLQWSSGALSDPAAASTVTLDFHLNFDTEPFYDLVEVRYLRGGQWETVLTRSGTSAVAGSFDPPGTLYSSLSPMPIVYTGGDYAGVNGDEIILQVRFTSDESYSDEDGDFTSAAGAMQIDDVVVQVLGGGEVLSSFEDFEGPGPYAWTIVPPRIVGDFAKILADLTDLDPCRENRSPQATFIDDGTPPNNAPGQSTGGSTSVHAPAYGTPGGWVVNYTGGLAGEGSILRNAILSPPIAIDAPGAEDDGPGWRLRLGYEVWNHTHGPLSSAYSVAVRTSSNGVDFGEWQSFDFAFAVPGQPLYLDEVRDLSQFVNAEPAQYIQVSFSPIDYNSFGLPWVATSAPWFDNVAVYKERSGTTILANLYGRLADAFPSSTDLDVSTPTARGALDVPMRARDGVTPRIDLVPAVQAALPQSVRMVWILEQNPLFENALRTLGSGATQLPGTGALGGERWTGSFVSSAASANTASFDLPQTDFLYPGDVLRYYYEVVASDGWVSTSPVDLAGFDDGVGWPEVHTLRALPTILDASGAVPAILLIDNARWTEGDSDIAFGSFTQNGLRPGLEFDHYRANHGQGDIADHLATSDPLLGYSIIALQDPDPSTLDELPLLTDWYAAAGDRSTLWIGSRLVSSVRFDAQALDRLGLEWVGVLDVVGSQGSQYPMLLPQDPRFVTTPVIDLQCFGVVLDQVRPVGAALAGHVIGVDPSGTATIADAAGSILHDRTTPEGRRFDVVLPFDLEHLRVPQLGRAGGDPRSAAAHLVAEVLELFDAPGGSATSSPIRRPPGVTSVSVEPNPFNPSTTIRFILGEDGLVRIRIVNLRGELVRELHDGWMQAGPQRRGWDGISDGGSPVASGVYLVDIHGAGGRHTEKLVLLK